MATKTLLTVEEFLRLPESVGNCDVRYELVEGELVTVSPGLLPHNLIRDRIYIHGLAGVTRRRGDDLLEDAEMLPGFAVKIPELFVQE